MSDAVAIIGFGAAGLMAGSLLGLEAYILEKKENAGKKLCLTGAGKCNFTHSGDVKELLSAYYEKKNFVRPALYDFPPEKIRDYFRKLGIESVVQENGKVFPKSMKAVDIRNVLSDHAGRVFYNQRVKRIVRSGEDFLIFTDDKIHKAGYVILATGGNTYPDTGSEGDGYQILKSLGHRIVPPRPALSQLFLEENPLKGASGITLPVTIEKGRLRIRESVVITEKGLSGPAAENFSRYIEGKEEICISFLDIDRNKIKKNGGKLLLKNALPLPERLLEALLGEVSHKKIADLTSKELLLIEDKLSRFRVNATVPTLSAMSTKGGVDTAEIDSKSMESKLVSNLYIVGEIMDVDAWCGGYSLTWAFASAYLAVKDIKRKKGEE